MGQNIARRDEGKGDLTEDKAEQQTVIQMTKEEKEQQAEESKRSLEAIQRGGAASTRQQ